MRENGKHVHICQKLRLDSRITYQESCGGWLFESCNVGMFVTYCPSCGELLKTDSEKYPANWKNVTIHFNSDSGEMHYDGNSAVREHIKAIIHKGMASMDDFSPEYYKKLKEKIEERERQFGDF